MVLSGWILLRLDRLVIILGGVLGGSLVLVIPLGCQSCGEKDKWLIENCKKNTLPSHLELVAELVLARPPT